MTAVLWIATLWGTDLRSRASLRAAPRQAEGLRRAE
jgi:hypothetical protein